ncbi:MAG: NUDIX domain-containing protein [Clostridia bacterium]|nr:NUDIX domain-containing protein [Clostridia bacterium]MBR2986356.1 NUDIX domain-containing protein [Clostridia bacterium]
MDNKQFDSIEQSAMAVVLCKGKILTTVEDIYGRNVLSLPKGHNEQGETLLQTAIRECFEETNIVLTEENMVKALTPYSYQFSTPSNKLVQKTIAPFLFEVESEGQTIAKEKRMISVGWMEISEFLQKCSYDNVKAIVKAIL